MTDDPNEKGSKSPKINVLTTIRDAIRDLENARDRSNRALNDLYALEQAAVKNAAGTMATKDVVSHVETASNVLTLKNLHLDRVGMNGASGWFDGARLSLSPHLSALVSVLICNEGKSDDELVAFLTFDQIVAGLREIFPGEYDHHYVSNLIHQLSKRLRKAELQGLIERSRSGGVRLRVKRRAQQSSQEAGK